EKSVFICIHLSPYSDETEVALTYQESRRLFAVSKNFAIARASDFFRIAWKRFNSSMNVSTERAMFFRFDNAMSRHISGEPDAMRVVSRKPVAHRRACCFGLFGSKTRLASDAATTCGK